jgi:ABC-type histidine transport system ATPase subunit
MFCALSNLNTGAVIAIGDRTVSGLRVELGLAGLEFNIWVILVVINLILSSKSLGSDPS